MPEKKEINGITLIIDDYEFKPWDYYFLPYKIASEEGDCRLTRLLRVLPTPVGHIRAYYVVGEYFHAGAKLRGVPEELVELVKNIIIEMWRETVEEVYVTWIDGEYYEVRKFRSGAEKLMDKIVLGVKDEVASRVVKNYEVYDTTGKCRVTMLVPYSLLLSKLEERVPGITERFQRLVSSLDEIHRRYEKEARERWRDPVLRLEFQQPKRRPKPHSVLVLDDLDVEV